MDKLHLDSRTLSKVPRWRGIVSQASKCIGEMSLRFTVQAGALVLLTIRRIGLSKWLSLLLECKSNNLCFITNIRSLINFTNDLKILKINENHKFIIHDIKYLFLLSLKGSTKCHKNRSSKLETPNHN